MISPKLTHLNRAVLTSILMFCSTASFAENNEAQVAKPFDEGMNIQDFTKLANDGATFTFEEAKVNAIDLAQAKEISLNVVEDADATIAAAKKAGVLDAVKEQKIAIKEKAEQVKVTIVKKTPVTTPVTPPISDQKADESPVAPSSVTNTNDGTIDNFDNQTVKAGQTVGLSSYAKEVNNATWSKDMKTNAAMTLKMQALLDWNHASPGPVDGGWGGNSRKALKNFQAMKGLETTGRMNEATWKALTKDIPSKRPVFLNYTITQSDTNHGFTKIPATYPEKAKLSAMNYNNMAELLGERFHMSVDYLKKLNQDKKFVVGETILAFNPSSDLKSKITRIVADKKAETLYAYSGNKLVATYPTTVGSSTTPSPHGTFKIVNNVKKPHYRATVEKEGQPKKVYMLKPGPNSPVGIVWMGLSKPSYGIHGSPIPEGISRQASHGCIRLTNWDAIEVHKNVKIGAKVELK